VDLFKIIQNQKAKAMVTLTEKDVEILDPILEIIITKGRVHSDRLPPLEKHYLSKFSEVKSSEYSRYLDILELEGIAKIEKDYGKFTITSIHPVAQDLYDQGGFKKVHEDQIKAEEKRQEVSELELKKLRYDVKLSKWQVKTFWCLFFIAIVGSILGAIAFFCQVL
jgi:hypothetical protein